MNINNLFGVRGKVVLITGGSRGIGEMMASGFLANGAKVYISSRKIKDCDATAQRLSEKYESECISIPADISDLNGINELFTNFDKYNDNLDVLINNAGAPALLINTSKLSLYLSKLVNSSLIPFKSEISAGIDIHSDSYFSDNRCAVASQSFIFLELM